MVHEFSIWRVTMKMSPGLNALQGGVYENPNLSDFRLDSAWIDGPFRADKLASDYARYRAQRRPAPDY